MNPTTPKTKPTIAQPAVASLWLKPDDVQELRAMYPQARDEELAELSVYLNSFPDGMAYLRRNPNMFEYALMGTRSKCIAFTTSYFQSIPRDTPQEPKPDALPDNAGDNRAGGSGR